MRPLTTSEKSSRRTSSPCQRLKQQGAVLYADASPRVRAAVIRMSAAGRSYLATLLTTTLHPLEELVSELEAFARAVR